MDIGVARRTRSKMASIRKASEVGDVSLSSHVEQRQVRQEDEEIDTNADAKEGLRERNDQIEQVSPKQVKNDATLGDGEIPASQTKTSLPLKFRFEDEVEKIDSEMEIDGLYDELDRDWAFAKTQSLDHHKGNLETENSPPPPGETQHARCCRGKHELVLRDDEGLICKFCRHVELGPKDVMPQWVEISHKESKRKEDEVPEQVEKTERPASSSVRENETEPVAEIAQRLDLHSNRSDHIEAAVLDLEEYLNKIKWLKKLMMKKP